MSVSPLVTGFCVVRLVTRKLSVPLRETDTNYEGLSNEAGKWTVFLIVITNHELVYFSNILLRIE
jgi:hypothetical protein